MEKRECYQGTHHISHMLVPRPMKFPAAQQGGASAIIPADKSTLRFDKLQGILAKANKAGKGVQDAF